MGGLQRGLGSRIDAALVLGRIGGEEEGGIIKGSLSLLAFVVSQLDGGVICWDRNPGGGNLVGEGLQVNFGYTTFVISHGDVRLYI